MASQAVTEHRADAPSALNLAVMTVSDTRTLENDTSGALIVAMAEAAGHRVLERVDAQRHRIAEQEGRYEADHEGAETAGRLAQAEIGRASCRERV